MFIFGAIDIPVLDFWLYFLLVSKPEWAALFTLRRKHICVHFLSFTSGALALHMASIAASHFLHMQIFLKVLH